ncbi:TetR/AcrR family transcriptional regulator [Nakamurella sp. A5-74]|uniref:TetR/AcrR family transcriptional regulator n=1 Tax=Nakamurella sp. A5-74 TaxID=3158264 RepID=A0AAU8DNY0_9ACTN
MSTEQPGSSGTGSSGSGSSGTGSKKPTARAIARESLTAEILVLARRHLVEHGADGLSLRAISRDLGMVSSAIYRYFPSRDDLLTALIVQSYGNLGDAVASAGDQPDASLRQRFIDICGAVRVWAKGHPQEWALIYGSPVPGYQAPQTTIEPATRVILLVFDVVVAAWGAGRLEVGDTELDPVLVMQAAQVLDGLGRTAEVPPIVVVRAAECWTYLLGVVSSELFGQLANTFDPADRFALWCWANLADRIGLR